MIDPWTFMWVWNKIAGAWRWLTTWEEGPYSYRIVFDEDGNEIEQVVDHRALAEKKEE
jgi:hypothetical protein